MGGVEVEVVAERREVALAECFEVSGGLDSPQDRCGLGLKGVGMIPSPTSPGGGGGLVGLEVIRQGEGE